MTDQPYWGYLREVFRTSKAAHQDDGKAMYDMVSTARQDGCPDDVFRGLVEDLRHEGSLAAYESHC
jgi:hypothetical protein